MLKIVIAEFFEPYEINYQTVSISKLGDHLSVSGSDSLFTVAFWHSSFMLKIKKICTLDSSEDAKFQTLRKVDSLRENSFQHQCAGKKEMNSKWNEFKIASLYMHIAHTHMHR